MLGGGGLMAAFPLAYAIILPALYAPLIAMLLGAGLPRRRLRVPLARSRPSALLGLRLHDRLARRDPGAGHHARRPAPGHRGRGPRLCRRLVGLADAVQPAGRGQPGRRLCPARRDLADHEDRGHGPGALLPPVPRKLGIATDRLHRRWSARQHRSSSGAYYERWFAWPQVLFTAQVPLLVGICSVAVPRQPARAAGSTGRSCSRWRCSLCACSASAITMFPYVVPAP